MAKFGEFWACVLAVGMCAVWLFAQAPIGAQGSGVTVSVVLSADQAAAVTTALASPALFPGRGRGGHNPTTVAAYVQEIVDRALTTVVAQVKTQQANVTTSKLHALSPASCAAANTAVQKATGDATLKVCG